MKFLYTPISITLAFFLLCSLSIWQLQRGLEKQAILDSRAHQAQLRILTDHDITDLFHNPDRYHDRIIKLIGHFQNTHTILLDNKIHDGQVGYYVITPFVLDHNKTILINRGWIPRGSSRAILPNILPVLNQKMTIKGQIAIPRKNRFITNKLETNQFPFRIQEIDFQLLAPLFSTQLGSALVILSSDSLFSFEAIPEKAIWLNPEKHFAYAVQWLLLALSLVIIYTIVCYKQKEKSHVNHH